jgi:hypothetical protein
MKLQRNSKAAAVLVGGLGVALLTGGTAYAVWTTSGTGTGTASATTAQPVTVTATAVGNLFPGAKVPATLVFSNPNPFAITVTSIVPTAGPTTVTNGLDNAACTTTPGVVFATLTGSWTVPAKGTANGTITPAPQVVDAVEMTNASVSGCQGATFGKSYSFTAQSEG